MSGFALLYPTYQLDKGAELSSEFIKGGVSIGALGFVVLHLFWPGLGIDLVTIALLFVAALPWVGPVLKGLAESGVRNLELPGGIKIELADVKSATDKVIRITGAVLAPMPKLSSTVTSSIAAPLIPFGPSTVDPIGYIGEIASTDANLALVAFRIEIEKRLRALAEAIGVPSHRANLSQLVRQLQRQEVLSTNMASGLMELIGFGNRAAHGVEVAQDAAAWVLDIAPSIVMELDSISNSARAQNNSVIPKNGDHP